MFQVLIIWQFGRETLIFTPQKKVIPESFQIRQLSLLQFYRNFNSKPISRYNPYLKIERKKKKFNPVDNTNIILSIVFLSV